VDDETKDLLKEAYNYGYAHAIEDVEKIFSNLKNNVNFNEEYSEAYDILVSEFKDVLKEFAKDKKRE
jgi:hypothetical protein